MKKEEWGVGGRGRDGGREGKGEEGEGESNVLSPLHKLTDSLACDMMISLNTAPDAPTESSNTVSENMGQKVLCSYPWPNHSMAE